MPPHVPEAGTDPARAPAPALLRGCTGVFTLQRDRRFGYCLYVPARPRGGRPKGLLVTVHDSAREFIGGRDGFAAFGERHGHVVLAPLFPINVLGNGSGDGYKTLLEVPLRYDLLLDAMIDEVAALTRCPSRRFLLHGYSGGAQFAHRYLLLHPRRVSALSIGAPGQVTLPDPGCEWPAGVAGIEALFGVPFDVRALRRVPVQLLVGDRDTSAPPARAARVLHAGDETEATITAATRVERLRGLADALRAAGLRCDFRTLRGLGHDEAPARVTRLAAAFFARQRRLG